MDKGFEKEVIEEEIGSLYVEGGMSDIKSTPKVATEEVSEEMDTLIDEADEFGNAIKRSKVTTVVELVDEDLGQESIAQAEDLVRQKELEKEAQPLIEEHVSEAIKHHNAKLKREAAELIYEHDTTILENVKQARLEDRKERKRQRRNAKIRSLVWFVAIVGVIFIICTNSQVSPLVHTVATNLYDMIIDLVNDKETSSNELVDSSLEELGDLLNDANTKVVVVEE